MKTQTAFYITAVICQTGIADSYDRDNNLFIERTIKYVVDSNTVINTFPDEANKPLLARFYFSNSDIANFTDGVTGTNLICRSEMQKAISYFNINRSIRL